MNPDFLIQFVINRSSGSNYILLTDSSTGVSNLKGNFKVTYPDGSIYENSDYLSPDISAVAGSVQITLKDGSDGEVMTGSYTFIYSALDEDADTFDKETKTFEFSFDEPELEVTNTSDVAIPRVAFSVPFNFEVTGFTETISTFSISADFPSTSDVSGSSLSQNLTSGSREMLMISGSDYYEGEYNPVADFVATYQDDALSYLSVSFTDQSTTEILINEARTSTELLALIEAYKDSEGCDISQYNRIVSLYSNIESNIREGNVDEGNELLSELYERLGITPNNAYLSTPMTGIVFISNDLANYYTKAEVDALLTTVINSLGLTEDITVSVNGSGVGGFDYLQVASQGTLFTAMWKELLRSATAPTYVAPTLTISGSNLSSGTKTGEVGDAETVTITPTATQNDGGAFTVFTLDNNGSTEETDNTPPIPDASYNSTLSTVEGSYIYDASISYDQGAVKNNDLGDPDPTGQIGAGSVNSNAVTYNRVYPWFFGTSASQSITGSDVYSGTKVIETIGSSIQAAFSGTDVYLWFAVPSSNNNPKTYTAWEDDNDANNASSIGGTTNLFGDPSVVSVTSTGLDSNYTINYDVYVTNWKTNASTFNLS